MCVFFAFESPKKIVLKVRFGIRNLRNTDINKQLKIQTDINVLNEMAQISGQTKHFLDKMDKKSILT